MKIITAAEFSTTSLEFEVNNERIRQIDETVLNIIDDVRTNGDNALFRYAEKFDRVKLDQLLVTEEEFNEAEKMVSEQFIKAITAAKHNIADFHKRQLENSWITYKDDGIMLGQKVTPMDRVGIYVPGGKAAYPSTVLMNAVPAAIAQVPEILAATSTCGLMEPSSCGGVAIKISGTWAIAAGTAFIKTVEG